MKFLLRSLINIFELVLLATFIYDLGFTHSKVIKQELCLFYILSTLVLLGTDLYKQKKDSEIFLSTKIFGIVLSISLLLGLYQWFTVGHLQAFEDLRVMFMLALGFHVIRKFSIFINAFYNGIVNPALLLVLSFAFVIIVGGLSLMLPNATTRDIGFTDSMFISTSAVCVTGLSTLDISKDYTTMGQTIILILIQIGGLGILTFTSFFAYFFKGVNSFKENLYMRDFVGANQLNNVYKLLIKILLFTLSIEFIGAVYIFFAMPEGLGYSIGGKIFFSVFHSISAFCNAGFSTVQDGLYNPLLRFNYATQWMIMILIVSGGLGFNVIDSIRKFALVIVYQMFPNLAKGKSYRRAAGNFSLHDKIVLYTTSFLLIIGLVFFMFQEFYITLAEHKSMLGKFTVAMFQSVTPRTAGFNNINYADLTLPSVMVVMFLMWVGGSPASTAGGIKTTSFALATINIFNVARGKDKIEIFEREIAPESINRAFAIICISLIIIGFGIFLIYYFEYKLGLIEIAFECFSAFGTVGLTIGITPKLTIGSKWVLILLMFIGRVGGLTLLIGILKRLSMHKHQYPKENILIN